MSDSALNELLISGTDADIITLYSSFRERAGRERFGAFEDDVVVLDIETTGLHPERDSLIEVAAARLRGPEIVERFTSFVDPARRIPDLISELTGIQQSDVEGVPTPHKVLVSLQEFIRDTTVVAHNAAFDRSFLKVATPVPMPFTTDNSWCDSLELAQIALPRCRSFGLQDLSRVFADQQTTHRALDDVEGTCQLWRACLVALAELPAGLTKFISDLFPQVDWPLRPFIRQVAGSLPEARFSLINARRARMNSRPKLEKLDAEELDGGIASIQRLEPEELEADFNNSSSSAILARMYPGFEPRQEQLEMAQAVAQALNESTSLIVEAGTGVGKSMAYLLPLAYFARRNNICVGVATKTNSLLDQLLYHELPRLAEALPDGLVYQALKGYDHYPCLRKLMRLAGQPERSTRSEGIITLARLLTYVCQSSSGDLDRINLGRPGFSRLEFVASADDCLKRKCRFYNTCLLHGARRQAASSDIVITNQALLFCDVMSDGGILPPIRHWVVDEAHGMEAEARQQLSESVNSQELGSALDILLSSRGTLNQLREQAAPLAGADLLIGRIEACLKEAATLPTINTSFFSELKELASLAPSSGYDRVDLWIDEQVRNSAPWGLLYGSGRALSKRLEIFWKDCRDIVSLSNQFEELIEEQATLAGLTADIGTALNALSLILNGEDENYYYYAELDRRYDKGNDQLKAARLDIGELLVERFFPEELSVILTSATLATGKSFQYFAHNIGLDRLPEDRWRTLQLDSSYDFENNMRIYLPTDIPEPNQTGYLKALESLLLEVHQAMGGSVLTLFTNRRDMEKLYDRLKPSLAKSGLELRCQRSASKTRQLAEDFLRNKSLSLFALRSFWQGFDAPGETLRCVVIPKLPFSRPNDPLNCERNLREPNAWRRYSLPESVIELKQAAGRLIRSSNDSGVLILADARLLTKGYGSIFLESMPSQQRYTLSMKQIAEALSQEFPGCSSAPGPGDFPRSKSGNSPTSG
ncbi:MAG: DNA polymerase III subunit epsilon [Coriobacteriales bacterium]|jgi:ATP-dependent DNA helicase DinG|nr:DNA polymerase III subunit epsilon [Coriobacteriales bacterium]